MTPPRPWEPRGAALRIRLRVTPRARKEGIEGIVADAGGRPLLAVKVAAPPADGAANAAVLAILARVLALPRSAVTLEAGASARLKTVAASGDPAALAARLEAALPARDSASAPMGRAV